MRITDGSVASRVGCLTAGILVGGINFLLARIAFGGRLRRGEARYRAHVDQSSDLVLVTGRSGVTGSSARPPSGS